MNKAFVGILLVGLLGCATQPQQSATTFSPRQVRPINPADDELIAYLAKNKVGDPTWLLSSIKQRSGAIQNIEPYQNIPESLPTNFIGNDIVKIIENVVAENKANGAVVDQFTTKTEIMSEGNAAAEKLSKGGYFLFVLGGADGSLLKVYNADKQAFEISMIVSEFSSSSDIKGTKSFRYLPIITFKKDIGAYEGKNGFGAKATVKEKEEVEYALAFTDNTLIKKLTDSRESSFSHLYKFTIPMTSAEARENQYDIKAVLVCKPISPLIVADEHSLTPSIDFPYHMKIITKAMYSEILQLWFINRKTGAVYMKVIDN